MAVFRKQISPGQALQKLRHYCGYQERCHQEVTGKLYSLGVPKAEHGEIIATLIADGFLNEERFATTYAGGKFRINQWGRLKIKHALQQKQVSEYCIKKAMKEIDEDQYLSLLNNLAKEKYDSLKSFQWLVRKKKTLDYLIQRGFEPQLIMAAIEKFSKRSEKE